MKKRMLALLLCAAMAMTAAACGKNNGEKLSDTESTGSTETVKSASIEYDAKDYVKLGKYNGMDIELDTDYSVSEADVEDYINNNVIQNYPFYKDLEKDTVEEGDLVNMDFTGTQNGEEFSGGSGTGYVLEIGSNSFIDGFEEGMIGMKVGEEKDLDLTFPEGYQNADLAGQAVVFHVKVNKIVEDANMSYNNLSDDYIAYLNEKVSTEYKNIEGFTSEITEYLESSNASQKDSAVRSAIISKLLEESTIDKLPDGLLDARMNEMIEQYKSYYCSDGSDLKEYVEANFGTTYDEFLTQIQGEVDQDLRTQMILEAIAEEEGIKFVEADFNEYVNSLVSSNGLDSADALFQNYGPSVESGKKYLQRVFVCNQALQLVVDNAKVTVAAPEESTEAVSDTEAVSETEQ